MMSEQGIGVVNQKCGVVSSNNSFRILVGSNNPAKIDRWANLLSSCDLNVEIVQPKELGVNLDLVEGFDSLQKNSEMKAIAYAKKANILALSDDTGFFIDELGGKPGVAARRWGGELPDNVSDHTFLEHVRKKIAALKDTSSYFETSVSIATPEGFVKTITKKYHGYLDKKRLNASFDSGYPLSAMFCLNETDKSWTDLTSEERVERDKDVGLQIKELIKNFILN